MGFLGLELTPDSRTKIAGSRPCIFQNINTVSTGCLILGGVYSVLSHFQQQPSKVPQSAAISFMLPNTDHTSLAAHRCSLLPALGPAEKQKLRGYQVSFVTPPSEREPRADSLCCTPARKSPGPQTGALGLIWDVETVGPQTPLVVSYQAWQGDGVTG